MNIDDQISRALLEAHPHDLPTISQYIKWIRFRRAINHLFYFRAHWVRSERRRPIRLKYPRVHWV